MNGRKETRGANPCPRFESRQPSHYDAMGKGLWMRDMMALPGITQEMVSHFALLFPLFPECDPVVRDLFSSTSNASLLLIVCIVIIPIPRIPFIVNLVNLIRPRHRPLQYNLSSLPSRCAPLLTRLLPF